MQIASDHVSIGKYDQNRKRIPEVDVQMGFYRRERAMMINLDTLFNITHEGKGYLSFLKRLTTQLDADNPVSIALLSHIIEQSTLPGQDILQQVSSTILSLIDKKPGRIQRIVSLLTERYHKSNFRNNVRKQINNSTQGITRLNAAILWSLLADKFAGELATHIWKDKVGVTLIKSLADPHEDALVRVFSLLALEKFAATAYCHERISMNNIDLRDLLITIMEECDKANKRIHMLSFGDTIPMALFSIPPPGPLREEWAKYAQLKMCAQWALDHTFTSSECDIASHPWNLKHLTMIMNPFDATANMKLANNGLELRNDKRYYESIRGTACVKKGKWYYEVLLMSHGIIQIGWATNQCCFSPDDGQGIGDDYNSFSFDTFRGTLWSDGMCIQPKGIQLPRCSIGDIVGTLLDLDNSICIFYINGKDVGMCVDLEPTNHKDVTSNQPKIFGEARNKAMASVMPSFDHRVVSKTAESTSTTTDDTVNQQSKPNFNSKATPTATPETIVPFTASSVVPDLILKNEFAVPVESATSESIDDEATVQTNTAIIHNHNSNVSVGSIDSNIANCTSQDNVPAIQSSKNMDGVPPIRAPARTVSQAHTIDNNKESGNSPPVRATVAVPCNAARTPTRASARVTARATARTSVRTSARTSVRTSARTSVRTSARTSVRASVRTLAGLRAKGHYAKMHRTKGRHAKDWIKRHAKAPLNAHARALNAQAHHKYRIKDADNVSLSVKSNAAPANKHTIAVADELMGTSQKVDLISDVQIPPSTFAATMERELQSVFMKASYKRTTLRKPLGLYPAISLTANQHVRVNFGNEPWMYAPPVSHNDYRPISEAGHLDEYFKSKVMYWVRKRGKVTHGKAFRPTHTEPLRPCYGADEIPEYQLQLTDLEDDEEYSGKTLNVDRGICTICYSEPSDTTLMPCQHGEIGSKCCMLINKCHLCRRDIQERLVNHPQ
ncbi:hypothetical protein G6F43_002106 [Rhizopus delemar]|nr:hypothetical protein G6F43_002106 [Rhizopus delemar]